MYSFPLVSKPRVPSATFCESSMVSVFEWNTCGDPVKLAIVFSYESYLFVELRVLLLELFAKVLAVDFQASLHRVVSNEVVGRVLDELIFTCFKVFSVGDELPLQNLVLVTFSLCFLKLDSEVRFRAFDAYLADTYRFLAFLERLSDSVEGF